jgi:hypothetical protein
MYLPLTVSSLAIDMNRLKLSDEAFERAIGNMQHRIADNMVHEIVGLFINVYMDEYSKSHDGNFPMPITIPDYTELQPEFWNKNIVMQPKDVRTRIWPAVTQRIMADASCMARKDQCNNCPYERIPDVGRKFYVDRKASTLEYDWYEHHDNLRQLAEAEASLESH